LFLSTNIIIFLFPSLPFALVIFRRHADKRQRIVKIGQVEGLGSYCSWLESRPLECVLIVAGDGICGSVVHIYELLVNKEDQEINRFDDKNFIQLKNAASWPWANAESANRRAD
jgi:hypothetical protein